MTKSNNKIKLIPNNGIPNWFLIILATISGFAVANIYYCQPLLEMIKQELNVSAVEVNQLTVMTQIGYALGIFFIIPMADLYNRRKLLTICLSILIISLLLLGSATNLNIAIISSFGIGVCSMIPQFFLPIASQYSTPKTKSKNVGYVLSGLLTGILLSRVLSGYIGELTGWRTIFYIGAILMAISLFILLRILPETESNFKGTYLSLMKSIFSLIKKYPEARICAIRSGFSFGSFLSMWACMAFHLSEKPFYAGSDIVGLLGLCGVIGVITASNTGSLIHKYGVRFFSYIGSILHIISWGIFFFYGYNYLGLIIGIILIDIGQQCIQLSNQSYTMSLNPTATNRMNTIFMTTYFLGGSMGTFFAGIGWQLRGWKGVVFVGLSFALLSLILSLISKAKRLLI